METQKNFQERRKDKRFRVKYPAFASINYSSKRIGKITDISKSGLALRYFKNGESSNEVEEIGLFNLDFSFYLGEIKTKIVSDFEIIGKKLSDAKELRRCGIQFKNLSDIQFSQLDNFIRISTSETKKKERAFSF